MDEIRKMLQDVKQVFNKELEILRKNQPEILEMRNMSQIKSSVGSLINSMKQGDDRTLYLKAR